jgi:hypothetical protein
MDLSISSLLAPRPSVSGVCGRTLERQEAIDTGSEGGAGDVAPDDARVLAMPDSEGGRSEVARLDAVDPMRFARAFARAVLALRSATLSLRGLLCMGGANCDPT